MMSSKKTGLDFDLRRISAAFFAATIMALMVMPFTASAQTVRERAEAALADKDQSFALYRKLTGRLDGKPYFVSTRGNIYGFKPGEPAVPMFSIMGLWTYQQDPLSSPGGYLEKRAYCGTHTAFGTEQEALSLVNPLNGKVVTPTRSMRATPYLYQTMLPEGIYGVGDWSDKRLFPKDDPEGPIHQSQVVGDHVYMIEQIYNQDFIDLVMKYEEITWTAELDTLMDPSVEFVPSNRIFIASGDAREREWLELDGEEAYLVWHVTGRKVATPEELPKALLSYAQENCPSHLDGDILPEPFPPQ